MLNLLTLILDRINSALLGDNEIQTMLTPTPPKLGEGKRRAMALTHVVDQLYRQLDNVVQETGEWVSIQDLYTDDGDLFAIAVRAGRLYRVSLFIVNGELSLGEWVQVQQEFSPVSAQRNITITRQKDGRYRLVCIAGTAILNRDGEIDSTTLFENFVARAEKSGKYPGFDFFHLREAGRIGQFDYLAVDGPCYIASGLIDDPDKNPLARHAIKKLQAEPEAWGTSIEYWPLEGEMVEVARGIQIPVYTDGENEWISLLPQNEACHLMTAVVTQRSTQEIDDMDARKREALLKLIDGDEALLADIESRIDGVERSISEGKMVSREADATDTPATDTPAVEGEVEQPQADTPATETEIELDDETISMIAAAAAGSPAFAAVLKPITDALAQVTQTLGTLAPRLEAVESRSTDVTKRLQLLERDEETKQREWQEDLPSSRSRTKVSYRPRVARGAADETEQDDDSVEAIAARNLNGLPTY